MLEIGSFRSQNCAGITRRAFLGAGASVPLAFGLNSAPSAASALETRRRAKSVLVVWLTGGPSHIDTFDPKPEAHDIAGPFAPIATRTPGVRFSELLPRLAARSHRFAVVRTAQISDFHDMRGLTGVPIRTQVASTNLPPNFGSIVARSRGADHLLPFVAIYPPGGRLYFDSNAGQGAGRLGSAYDPLFVFCSAEGRTWLPSLKLLPGLTSGRLSERRLLLEKLNAVRPQADKALPAAGDRQAAWDLQFDKAHRLLTTPDSQKVFELSREPQAVRDAYGHTSFGQSLVLARRLVEVGVPYVQVNWSTNSNSMEEGGEQGWDTHFNNFEYLANFNGPIFDRGFAALLDDLSERGLLESTLVLALGDMGRSPRINGGMAGGRGWEDGRDHWGVAGFVVWSGAGVQGGRIIGETDRNGAFPRTEPISSLMIGTTIVELAGVDSQARAELKVLEGGKVIHELF
jgi:hypothetical protein